MNIQSLSGTFLYVEDDILIQNWIVSVLEEAGFDLLIASDGAEALEILSSEDRSIDGVVTDVDLGRGPTGWNVARSARLRSASMPIIYASSSAEAEWMVNGVPFSRLVRKPYDSAHIVSAMCSLLAARINWTDNKPSRQYFRASPAKHDSQTRGHAQQVGWAN